MRAFLAGVGVALLLCSAVAAIWLATAGEPAAQVEVRSVVVERTDEPADASPEDVAPAAPARRRVDPATSVLRPGEIVLRPGEAFVFAQRRVVPAEQEPDADLVCLDVRAGTVSFDVPNGGAPIGLPVVVAGELPPATTLYERVEAVPAAVVEGVHWIGLRVGREPERARVLLSVRDAADRAYKLVATRIDDDPAVWRRAVHLRYDAVPASEEPFDIPVPEAVVAHRMSAADAERVARLVEPPAVPDVQFADFARGKHLVVDAIDEDLVLSGGSRDLLVRRPLGKQVELRSRNSLVLGGGIASEGRVNSRTYSAILVDGNHEGEIEVNSYGYVRITGDVLGKVNVRSYATVVVDGAVRGEIRISSYATLIVLGDVPEPARSIRMSSSNTRLFLGRYASEEALRGIGPVRPDVIHVRTSDLTSGEHEIAGKPVIVADPLWAELR